VAVAVALAVGIGGSTKRMLYYLNVNHLLNLLSLVIGPKKAFLGGNILSSHQFYVPFIPNNR
jgi:hypothetical protein